MFTLKLRTQRVETTTTTTKHSNVNQKMQTSFFISNRKQRITLIESDRFLR